MEPVLGTRAAAAFALSRKAGSYVEQARVAMPDRLQIYNLIMRLGASELLTPQLLAQVDSTGPLALQREVGPAESATARAPGYFGEVVLLMMMLEQ